MLLVVVLCLGLQTVDARSDNVDEHSLTDKDSICSLRCRQVAYNVLTTSLGLDPQKEQNTVVGLSVHSFFNTLKNVAERQGETLSRLSLGEFLQSIQHNRSRIGILVRKDGHVYVHFGTIRQGSRNLLQLCHGRASLFLLGKDQLRRFGFIEGWICSCGTNTKPVRLNVGSSELELNKIRHNFGLLMVKEEKHATFLLRNMGKQALIIGQEKTSCGCTISQFVGRRTLLPGKSAQVVVTMRSADTGSFRHHVWLPISNSEETASRVVKLELIGNIAQPVEIVPEVLDFGIVRGNLSIIRTVRLSQTYTDVFTLGDISLEHLPLRYTVETRPTGPNGQLVTYLVKFVLEPSTLAPGKYSDSAHIEIRGVRSPGKIVIPITVDVRDAVRAIPSVLSFNVVQPGETVQRSVRFASESAEIIKVVSVTSPKDCPVRVMEQGTTSMISVSPSFAGSGVWKCTIMVRVLCSEGLQQDIPIDCVAYVR